MAISAFFLVATEDGDKEVRGAAWLYLVASHMATLCLFAVFTLLYAANGSFTLAPPGQLAMSPGLTTPIFVLALVGFGLKAGIMPLHVWLPSAHAAAASVGPLFNCGIQLIHSPRQGLSNSPNFSTTCRGPSAPRIIRRETTDDRNRK